jgi:NAD+ kinase
MADRPISLPLRADQRPALARVGVVVHPARDVRAPVRALLAWSDDHDTEIVQVPVFGERQQHVADVGDTAGCDLIVAIGGDGTVLAAIRVAAEADLPVMGVACGSLGVLTTVPPNGVPGALARFAGGDWIVHPLPALEVARDEGAPLLAFNDIALLRAGQGQLRWQARVDGALFGRFAGDGCVVSTPMGSSGYSLSAGGPLLASGTHAFLLTPVSVHGGSSPPLVVAAGSTLQLDLTVGHGGARFEIDGQVRDVPATSLTVGFRAGTGKVVRFPGDEVLLERLRRRQIIIDSPRILADDSRSD